MCVRQDVIDRRPLSVSKCDIKLEHLTQGWMIIGPHLPRYGCHCKYTRNRQRPETAALSKPNRSSSVVPRAMSENASQFDESKLY